MRWLKCPWCASGVRYYPALGRRVRCRHCDGAIDPRRAEEFTDEDKRQIALRLLRSTVHTMQLFGLGQALLTAIAGTIFLATASSVGAGDLGWAVIYASTILILFASAVVIVAGATAARWGRWRLIGLTAGWLAVFSPFLLGIPLGLTFLAQMRRPEVRAAFGAPTPEFE